MNTVHLITKINFLVSTFANSAPWLPLASKPTTLEETSWFDAVNFGHKSFVQKQEAA